MMGKHRMAKTQGWAARLGFLIALSAAWLGTGAGKADEIPFLGDAPFEEVASPAEPGSRSPLLYTAPTHATGALRPGVGGPFLIWIEPGDPAPSIRLSIWREQWDEARTIATDPGLAADRAHGADFLTLPDGTWVCSWTQSSPDGTTEVRVSTSSDTGITWSTALRPSKKTSGFSGGLASLVEDTVEGFWVVWLEGKGLIARSDRVTGKQATTAEARLRAARWRKGAFDAPVTLDSGAAACSGTAAKRTLEGIAVAYRNHNSKTGGDLSLVRYERGVWGKPVLLNNESWAISDCPAHGPSVSSRDSLLAVAWYTEDQGKPRIELALSDSSAFRIDRTLRIDDGSPLSPPGLEWLPDESALVSWVEKTAGGAEVRARRVTLDGQAGPARVVAQTSPERTPGIPDIAVRELSIWVAWEEPVSPAEGTPGARIRIGRFNLAQARE